MFTSHIMLTVALATVLYWPPLSERDLLPEEDVAPLSEMWTHAQESGLLKDRLALLNEVRNDRRPSVPPFLRYANPELIQMMVEIYLHEYECFKKYDGPVMTIEDFNEVECAEEYYVETHGEVPADFAYGHHRDVTELALSTWAPEIFCIVANQKFYPVTPDKAYIAQVYPEEHLQAILTSEFELREDPEYIVMWMKYTVKGCNVRNGVGVGTVGWIYEILANNPHLIEEYHASVASFYARLMEALHKEGDAGFNEKAKRISRIIGRVYPLIQQLIAETLEE